MKRNDGMTTKLGLFAEMDSATAKMFAEARKNTQQERPKQVKTVQKIKVSK